MSLHCKKSWRLLLDFFFWDLIHSWVNHWDSLLGNCFQRLCLPLSFSFQLFNFLKSEFVKDLFFKLKIWHWRNQGSVWLGIEPLERSLIYWRALNLVTLLNHSSRLRFYERILWHHYLIIIIPSSLNQLFRLNSRNWLHSYCLLSWMRSSQPLLSELVIHWSANHQIVSCENLFSRWFFADYPGTV
jgi:hypothetical protein